jgi:uncharacterized RDD family membrane protein YckC
MTTDDDNRFAPPRAQLADPAAVDTGGHVYGGRWRRFWAAMLDGLFNGLITFPFVFASMGVDGYMDVAMRATAEGGSKLEMYATLLRVAAPGYVVLLLVQGVLLYAYGQSLGKKLLGLRVVRTDGSRVDFARSFFLRGGCANLVNFIPTVGPLLAIVDVCMIFRDSRQALHDQIADTVVVTADSSRAATLAGARAASRAA